MKKLLLILIWLFFVWNSFSINIDKCCIIETIDFKENFKKTSQKIQKYPNLKDEVNKYVSEIIKTVNKNDRFKKNKVKLYKEIANRTIEYVYNHNIREWTPSFLMLSYFTYKMYDLYQYEKTPSSYNLESKLEMLDQYPYSY